MSSVTKVICRLCLKSHDPDNSISVSQRDSNGVSITTLVKTLIPEVFLGISENPVICKPCCDGLREAYAFRIECLRTENLIGIYSRESHSSSPTLDLQEVVNYWTNLYKNKMCHKDVAKANLLEWFGIVDKDDTEGNSKRSVKKMLDADTSLLLMSEREKNLIPHHYFEKHVEIGTARDSQGKIEESLMLRIFYHRDSKSLRCALLRKPAQPEQETSNETADGEIATSIIESVAQEESLKLATFRIHPSVTGTPVEESPQKKPPFISSNSTTEEPAVEPQISSFIRVRPVSTLQNAPINSTNPAVKLKKLTIPEGANKVIPYQNRKLLSKKREESTDRSSWMPAIPVMPLLECEKLLETTGSDPNEPPILEPQITPANSSDFEGIRIKEEIIEPEEIKIEDNPINILSTAIVEPPPPDFRNADGISRLICSHINLPSSDEDEYDLPDFVQINNITIKPLPEKEPSPPPVKTPIRPPSPQIEEKKQTPKKVIATTPLRNRTRTTPAILRRKRHGNDKPQSAPIAIKAIPMIMTRRKKRKMMRSLKQVEGLHDAYSAVDFNNSGDFLRDHDYFMNPYERSKLSYKNNDGEAERCVCILCNLAHPADNHVEHMRTHGTECTICRVDFYNVFVLNLHAKGHDAPCFICGQMVSYAQYYIHDSFHKRGLPMADYRGKNLVSRLRPIAPKPPPVTTPAAQPVAEPITAVSKPAEPKTPVSNPPPVPPVENREHLGRRSKHGKRYINELESDEEDEDGIARSNKRKSKCPIKDEDDSDDDLTLSSLLSSSEKPKRQSPTTEKSMTVKVRIVGKKKKDTEWIPKRNNRANNEERDPLEPDASKKPKYEKRPTKTTYRVIQTASPELKPGVNVKKSPSPKQTVFNPNILNRLKANLLANSTEPETLKPDLFDSMLYDSLTKSDTSDE